MWRSKLVHVSRIHWRRARSICLAGWGQNNNYIIVGGVRVVKCIIESVGVVQLESGGLNIYFSQEMNLKCE